MEESQDEGDAVAADGDDQGKEKPWYPYITKTQFEKFLSRLQSKVPDEIDRDYVRAIIRTPSMIYRFLRGVEAMGLIDEEQRPTERLRRLVDKETRKQALSEVVRDLYPILMEKMKEAGGEMPDRDIVAFFRKETGMGNDSANKMKMFFKYLLSEADDTATDVQPAADTDDDSGDADSGDDDSSDADSADDADADGDDDTDDDSDDAAADAEDNVGNEADPPAQSEGRGRGRPAERSSQRGGNDRGGNDRGGNDRSGNERSGSERSGNERSGNERTGNERGGNERSGNERSGNDRGERSGNDRGERGGNDRSERGGNDRSERGGNDRSERGGSERGGGDREERGGRGGRGGRGRGGDRNERNDRNERDRSDSGERDSERVPSNRPLTEAQRAYLDTLKSVLRVNVDGDWDDDMIRLAFDRLERLFDRIRRG